MTPAKSFMRFLATDRPSRVQPAALQNGPKFIDIADVVEGVVQLQQGI
jgi:hypothetical protein